MRVKNLVLIFILLLISGIFISQSFGWKISAELAQELAQKEKAVELNPADPDAHFDLAITYAYANRIEDGYKELEKVNTLDKGYASKVIHNYSKLIEKNPADWKLYFSRAFGFYFAGRKNMSILDFEKVIELDPENVFAYGFIGTLYADLGDFSKGMQIVKKAIRIDSNVAVLHYLLGQACYHQGDNWGGFKETMEALRLKALGY